MKYAVSDDTQIKIFSAIGGAGIDGLDEKVNAFIEQDHIRVISVMPQMCSVGHGRDEIYQSMTITILFAYV